MVYHTSNIHLLFISIIYLKNFSRAKNNNLSKFVKIRVHNHRVQSYILQNARSRISQSLCDPGKRKKNLPPRKNENSPNPIQFYRSSIREKQVSQNGWNIHPLPPRQSSARFGILLARGSKDEGLKRWIVDGQRPEKTAIREEKEGRTKRMKKEKRSRLAKSN